VVHGEGEIPVADGTPACLSGVRITVQAGEAPGVLVLTRKANQSIMIGDDIEVSVLAIMGEKVRIGIQAPRSIPVFRKEVYEEIQEGRGEGGDTREEVDEALDRLKRPQ
jgi:carbon storage regulator